MKQNNYKTIRHGQAVRMSTWDVNRKSQMAMINDMGVQDWYKDHVTDSDRVFASARTIFLSNDPAYYEQDDKKYSNPLELINGETVMLESNGKLYRVVDKHPRKWAYIMDPIAFELIG